MVCYSGETGLLIIKFQFYHLLLQKILSVAVSNREEVENLKKVNAARKEQLETLLQAPKK